MDLHELFTVAHKYYTQLGYNLAEPDAETRENNWHHALALAVDDNTQLPAFQKLHFFSRCIRNFEAEMARLNSNEQEENHGDAECATA